MPRPYWTGQIQISLVSFTVKLFVATESKGEIRFHQIRPLYGRARPPPEGARLRHRAVARRGSWPSFGAGRKKRHRQGIRVHQGPVRHHRTRRDRAAPRPLKAHGRDHPVRCARRTRTGVPGKSRTSSPPRTICRPRPSPSSAAPLRSRRRPRLARSPSAAASTSLPSPPLPATA